MLLRGRYLISHGGEAGTWCWRGEDESSSAQSLTAGAGDFYVQFNVGSEGLWNL